MKVLVNSKSGKMCMLCKHFFNPSCSGITPKPGSFLEIEREFEAICMKTRLKKKAWHMCPHFERKDF